jgi:hypothetical protein
MLLEKLKTVPKKYVYAAAAVAFVVLIAVMLQKSDSDDVNNALNTSDQSGLVNTSTADMATSTAASSTVKKSTVKPAPAPLSATQRYLDAIKIYKTAGYYFQFVDCHGLPGSLTLKKGKKFMLDNRDNKTRKIAIVGGQSFNLTAYNFAIATAPSTPGTHYITCDGGGAASILVQP